MLVLLKQANWGTVSFHIFIDNLINLIISIVHLGFYIKLNPLVFLAQNLVTKPAFKGRQPGQMGVAATPKCKRGAYWTHWEMKIFGGSDQRCSDCHTFFLGYFILPYKQQRGSGGLPPEIVTMAFLTMPGNPSLQTSLISS